LHQVGVSFVLAVRVFEETNFSAVHLKGP
jgi:hypothetical protein